jgi:3-vinyl bacteriochlorophyllide hydratase
MQVSLHRTPQPPVEQADPVRAAGPGERARPASAGGQAGRASAPLYTPEERARRDASRWTLVQGILAPLQFLAFLVSLALVARYLATGDGLVAASASVVIKTAFLYAIMITGSLWEHDVFGEYLFAPAFFWEDVVSMGVIALHTAYLVALFAGLGTPRQQMLLALAAYATYAVNAFQFLWKLRRARLDHARSGAGLTAPATEGAT